MFGEEQLASSTPDKDIGDQRWQFIFSLFVKLATKNLIFKKDILSIYSMNEQVPKVKQCQTHFCLVGQNCVECKKDVSKFLLAANFSPGRKKCFLEEFFIYTWCFVKKIKHESLYPELYNKNKISKFSRNFFIFTTIISWTLLYLVIVLVSDIIF